MRETTKEQIWLVIAAFNEGSMIHRVVSQVIRHGYRLVVVDDGSADNTTSAAKGAGADCVRHAVNLGQGAALQTGIDYARRLGATQIVTFDADGQHNIDDVPALLQALDGADVALGSRGLGRVEGARLSRRLLLRVATFVSNRLSGLKLTDSHCGLRAFRAEVFDKIRIRQDRMAHASELLSLIARENLKVVEVPVVIEYTEYSMRHGQSGFQAVRILFDHFFRA